MNRPEWIKCIRLTPDGEVARCGRRIGMYDWAFLNIVHAVNTSATEGRLTVCPDCANPIIKALISSVRASKEGEE